MLIISLLILIGIIILGRMTASYTSNLLLLYFLCYYLLTWNDRREWPILYLRSTQ